jgi:diadenosine tetraphosphate (Ap4A) HIT family hydrolase
MGNQINICPFCNKKESEKILSSILTYAVYDSYPISKGHTLVIPKRHISNYFLLEDNERNDCWDLINKLKEELEKEYNPDGFNIGININEAAGQTVHHVHIHLIPRYSGDIPNPRGGIRNIIPGKGEY